MACPTWPSATSRRCSRAIRAASPFRRRCTRSAPSLPSSYTSWRVLAAAHPDGGERLALTHRRRRRAPPRGRRQPDPHRAGRHLRLLRRREDRVDQGGSARRSAACCGHARASSRSASTSSPIITSLAEALFAKHLLDPERPRRRAHARARRRAQRRRSTACAPRFRPRDHREADRSVELRRPQVYAAIRAAAQRRWSRVGQHFGTAMIPTPRSAPGADLGDLLRPRGPRRAARAGQRSATGGRASSVPRRARRRRRALARRELVRERLDALDAAEARERMYTPQPPDASQRDWWIPIGYLIALLVRRAPRRRRVRRRGARIRARLGPGPSTSLAAPRRRYRCAPRRAQRRRPDRRDVRTQAPERLAADALHLGQLVDAAGTDACADARRSRAPWPGRSPAGARARPRSRR